jgi:hypothetical protein
MTSLASRQTSSKRSRPGTRSWGDLLNALGLKGKLPASITEEIVDRARLRPLGFRYTLRDGVVPGLALRVGAQGGPGVWWLGFRSGAGKREFLKLDVVPGATPRAARAAAATQLASLRHDVNPAALKRERKAAVAAAHAKVSLRSFIEGDYWTKKLRLRKDGASDKLRVVAARLPDEELVEWIAQLR